MLLLSNDTLEYFEGLFEAVLGFKQVILEGQAIETKQGYCYHLGS